MAKFKVYHIGRTGHVERSFLRAETKRQAWLEAKKKFDDVIKVKRAAWRPTSGFIIFVVIVILLIVLFAI